jgi:phytoene dehydrogenase-like protein
MTDAVIVGSGPNGLAAAITLAKAGVKTLVLEGASEIGGGTRSGALTLPGFTHDYCSAVHPLAAASPFFRDLPLEKHGLEWITPPKQVAHPLDGGDCVTLPLCLDEAVNELGRGYGILWRALARHWEEVLGEILAPPLHVPRHPFLLARIGLHGLLPATAFARTHLRGTRLQALFAGIAAHANAPLTTPGTTAVALALNLAAHARGWPFPRGGASAIAKALGSVLKEYGGEIQTNRNVNSSKDLPACKLVLWDVTPTQLQKILGLDPGSFRHGPGVFKLDWALSGPIPWRNPAAAQSATVHLGGTLAEITAAEAAPARGEHAEKPYVLLSQPTLFDPSRAPTGKHVAWAYCHVPAGSTRDMTNEIESQIERFAPGFRGLVLARAKKNTRDLEAFNPNYVGGDINAGALTLRQLLFRPSVRLDPYRLPKDGHFLCSAATPPGPGVHGMSGVNAARSALKWLRKQA